MYGRDYEVSNIAASGSAAKLTFINYAFGNVYAKNGGYECDMITKLEPGATNPNAPDAGTGPVDAGVGSAPESLEKPAKRKRGAPAK